MKIKFMKTHPDAVIPTRGSAGAAGFDLTAVSLKRAADLYIYDTGLALEIPSGYWGGIYARSSIFFTGLEKCGCVTVVDSDYRGSILCHVPRSARRPARPPSGPAPPVPRKNGAYAPLQAGRQNRPAHHPAVRGACPGARHPLRNEQHSALLRS